MKVKFVVMVTCIGLMLFANPLFSYAELANSIGAYDTGSSSYYGSYADNYVDGNTTFGPTGWDCVVNSAYLEHDPWNGIEVGWMWQRFFDGTKQGPFMFAARIWYGQYSNSGSLGLVSKNSWYRWKVQSQQPNWSDDFDCYANNWKKFTYYNNGWYSGYAKTSEEHQMDESRFGTYFSNMAKQGSNTSWYMWEGIEFDDDDSAYNPAGNRYAWQTLLD